MKKIIIKWWKRNRETATQSTIGRLDRVARNVAKKLEHRCEHLPTRTIRNWILVASIALAILNVVLVFEAVRWPMKTGDIGTLAAPISIQTKAQQEAAENLRIREIQRSHRFLDSVQRDSTLRTMANGILNDRPGLLDSAKAIEDLTRFRP